MHRKRLLLFLFILFAFGLMTYQANRQPILPFQFLAEPLHILFNLKESAWEFVTSPFRRMLIREEENRRLMDEIMKMREERQVWEETRRENEKLRALLALKERERHYVTSARVIARGTDQWSHTLVLDKGSADGIKKDMVAVTEQGLVGKIADVRESYASLLLVTDISFSAAARLQDGRTEGILSGTGSKMCQLKYIPYDEDVKPGGIVITSGLDSLFPAGIPLGHVAKVSRKESGLFQYIEVVPSVDNTKIEVVAIIGGA